VNNGEVCTTWHMCIILSEEDGIFSTFYSEVRFSFVQTHTEARESHVPPIKLSRSISHKFASRLRYLGISLYKERRDVRTAVQE
jgi:hypothetical protein